MSLKKLTTKKLFYKKYPYKISCHISGGWLIRSFGLENTKIFCETGKFPVKLYSNPTVYKEELKKFVDKIAPYIEKVKVRIEQKTFDIYIDNIDLYYNILSDLQPWAVKIWAPENQEILNILLEDNRVKILCEDLPYNCYKYKVHIRHRLNDETKKSFSEWIQNYQGKILATGETFKWLYDDFHWSWTPHIYVKDQATLSMVGLFLGSWVQKVEEYVARNSINTP